MCKHRCLCSTTRFASRCEEFTEHRGPSLPNHKDRRRERIAQDHCGFSIHPIQEYGPVSEKSRPEITSGLSSKPYNLLHLQSTRNWPKPPRRPGAPFIPHVPCGRYCSTQELDSMILVGHFQLGYSTILIHSLPQTLLLAP